MDLSLILNKPIEKKSKKIVKKSDESIEQFIIDNKPDLSLIDKKITNNNEYKSFLKTNVIIMNKIDLRIYTGGENLALIHNIRKFVYHIKYKYNLVHEYEDIDWVYINITFKRNKNQTYSYDKYIAKWPDIIGLKDVELMNQLITEELPLYAETYKYKSEYIETNIDIRDFKKNQKHMKNFIRKIKTDFGMKKLPYIRLWKFNYREPKHYYNLCLELYTFPSDKPLNIQEICCIFEEYCQL